MGMIKSADLNFLYLLVTGFIIWYVHYHGDQTNVIAILLGLFTSFFANIIFFEIYHDKQIA